MINTNLTDFDQVYKLGNMVCIFLKLYSLGFLLNEANNSPVFLIYFH